MNLSPPKHVFELGRILSKFDTEKKNDFPSEGEVRDSLSGNLGSVQSCWQ